MRDSIFNHISSGTYTLMNDYLRRGVNLYNKYIYHVTNNTA